MPRHRPAGTNRRIPFTDPKDMLLSSENDIGNVVWAGAKRIEAHRETENWENCGPKQGRPCAAPTNPRSSTGAATTLQTGSGTSKFTLTAQFAYLYPDVLGNESRSCHTPGKMGFRWGARFPPPPSHAGWRSYDVATPPTVEPSETSGMSYVCGRIDMVC